MATDQEALHVLVFFDCHVDTTPNSSLQELYLDLKYIDCPASESAISTEETGSRCSLDEKIRIIIPETRCDMFSSKMVLRTMKYDHQPFIMGAKCGVRKQSLAFHEVECLRSRRRLLLDVICVYLSHASICNNDQDTTKCAHKS